MSKKQKILFFILPGMLALPLAVSAQLFRPASPVNPARVVGNAVDAAWVIFAALAVICFLISGAMFLTAQGDPSKLKLARSAFFWGIAGVVVGIVAFSITNIIGTSIL